MLRLSRARFDTRTLAYVAIFMPMRPASMDQIPPVRKAKGVNLDSMLPPLAKAMMARITKTTANTFATVEYWCFRYALAPSRMLLAIFCIVALPSE